MAPRAGETPAQRAARLRERSDQIALKATFVRVSAALRKPENEPYLMKVEKDMIAKGLITEEMDDKGLQAITDGSTGDGSASTDPDDKAFDKNVTHFGAVSPVHIKAALAKIFPRSCQPFHWAAYTAGQKGKRQVAKPDILVVLEFVSGITPYTELKPALRTPNGVYKAILEACNDIGMDRGEELRLPLRGDEQDGVYRQQQIGNTSV